MNSLPTTSKEHCSCRTISRHGYLLTPFSRSFINFRCSKLYLHSIKYTNKRTSIRTNSFIHLSRILNSNSSTFITTSTSRSDYYTPNRPKPKYFILRPCRRRRPSSISTPILILRASRSIHFNSTSIRGNLPYCST